MKKILRKGKHALLRATKFLRYCVAFETYTADAEQAYALLEERSPRPHTSAITHNDILEAEYDLTVIVPAYNAEAWLEQCMDSILNQDTAYTYHVVLVNDGSKDNTAKVADLYANDPRVTVIHQENKGHSGARNTALKTLKSEYVMFVDSDDYLLPGAIDTMLAKAKETTADIVEGNAFQFDESGRLGSVKPIWNAQSGFPWMKVIRASLFEKVHFPEGYLYEDTIIGSLIYPLADRTEMIPDEVYAYRIHENSITQKHTAEMNRVHSFWIMLLMHENMKELGLQADYETYCRDMRHIVFTYRRMIMLPEEIKKTVFLCTRDFMMSTYGELLNTNDTHRRLAKALQKEQYGKYCVLCEK